MANKLRALSFCLAGLFSVTALGAELDPQSGRLSLKDAGFSLSFDAVPKGLVTTVQDKDFVDYSASEIASLFKADPDGLEGSGALTMGGKYYFVIFTGLDSLLDDYHDRRVEFRIWEKPKGTRATVCVRWDIADERASTLCFQPTGRATDDGWQELSSGPVDLLAGGVFAPKYMFLMDEHYRSGDQRFYAGFDPATRVLIDAFEVVDLGPAVVPRASCSMVDELLTCGDEGVCLYGRCVDAAMVDGVVPRDPTVRKDYLDRLVFIVSNFAGAKVAHARIKEFEAAIDDLRGVTTGASFWPTISRAMRLLRDAHARRMASSYWTSEYLHTCIHGGEADLLPGGGQLPMVFAAQGSDPVSSKLKEGDILVSVDGLSPYDWIDAVARYPHVFGDPESARILALENLITTALRSGATLRFARCDKATPCTAGEVTYLELDLAKIFGEPYWQGTPPPWQQQRKTCDWRFRRASNASVGYSDEDGIRTLLINGAYNTNTWMDTVTKALSPPPGALILDQRLALGGEILAVQRLVSLLVSADDLHAMEFVPWIDSGLDSDLLKTLRDCLIKKQSQAACGYFEHIGIGALVSSVAEDTPVALLNAHDVSANDFITKALTYRTAPIRIFAPGPTLGGFGPIMQMPIMFGEIVYGGFQYADSIFLASPSDANMDLLTGAGVKPDEIVIQKQSDAVQGIDTVTVRARAWLKGLNP